MGVYPGNYVLHIRSARLPLPSFVVQALYVAYTVGQQSGVSCSPVPMCGTIDAREVRPSPWFLILLRTTTTGALARVLFALGGGMCC